MPWLKLIFIVATMVIVTSCTKAPSSGIPFQAVTEWNSKEQVPRAMRAGSGRHYRATWTNGAVRHVCLENVGIGSLTTTWMLYVFDTNGTLIEHNTVSPYAKDLPRRLTSVAPLRIVFAHPDSPNAENVVEPDFSKEQWQGYTNKVQRFRDEAVATWEADKKKREEAAK